MTTDKQTKKLISKVSKDECVVKAGPRPFIGLERLLLLIQLPLHRIQQLGNRVLLAVLKSQQSLGSFLWTICNNIANCLGNICVQWELGKKYKIVPLQIENYRVTMKLIQT